MSNFINDYVAYASKICYAPEIYHKMMARVLIGRACQNKVFFQLGDTRIFGNFWMILLGLSSAYHKSTSVKIGLQIMDRIDENHRFMDQFSPEQIIPYLSARPSTTFYIDEFDSFLEILRKDYMGGGQGLITALHDSQPIITKKLAKEYYEVRFPTLSIWAATTLSGLLKNILESDIGRGLIPRFLYVYAKNKHKDSSKVPPAVDEIEKNRIVQKLHDIMDFAGVNALPDNHRPPLQVTFTKDALEAYMKWQDVMESEMVRDSFVMPFLSRLTVYIIKLSMIEALDDFSIEVRMEHFNKALEMVNFLHDSIVDLCSNEFAFNEFAKNRKRVLDVIRHEPMGISRTILLRDKVRLPKKELSDILEQLVEGNLIEEKNVRVGDAKKHTTFYVYNENKL